MLDFFFFKKLKWIILTQSNGLPSTRCAKEETPKFKQNLYNNYMSPKDKQKE